MKPFYHMAPQIWTERAFYAFFPLWRAWLNRQPWPDCNVVQAIMGYGTEPFDRADRTGAFKVISCQNSHPITYYGIPQSEYDVWCPGARVCIPQWMFARMNRELQRADIVLCPSTFVRDTMIEFGVPGEKCFINPFGVEPGLFRPREKTPDKPRFVSLGTICLRKGHHYLFSAFEQVKKQLPEAELICIGNIKADLRQELPKWRGLFVHRENLSYPEVAEIFQGSTALVLASLEEGFSQVILEAMSAGLPVVVTHESGATTLVTDGVEGFIVRSRDPEHLAEKMLKIASNPVMNRKMGEAAYQKGVVKNTWQDYGDRLLEEYHRRLNR
jgi:glycosyltransferase involved in cell wall biosynthesis